MRKYTWIVVLALIGCMIAFAGCQRIAKVVAPGMPDPEPPEVVETPTETEPTEVVETPTETEPTEWSKHQPKQNRQK